MYCIGRGRPFRTVSLVHERHALLNALAQLLLRLLQASSARRHQAKRLLWEREKFVMICRYLGMEATTDSSRADVPLEVIQWPKRENLLGSTAT